MSASARSVASVLLLAAGAGLAACSNKGSEATASGNLAAKSEPAPTAATAPPATAPPPAAPGAPAPVVAAVSADAGGAPSATVKLVFRTFPSRPAVVMWGGKRLGVIDRNKPLVVERPRDSGPLDVIVRSTGFIPVHTRAYTFNDGNIDVKMTMLDKKDTIYGYKEPLPPDAGVPFPSEAAEIPE